MRKEELCGDRLDLKPPDRRIMEKVNMKKEPVLVSQGAKIYGKGL